MRVVVINLDRSPERLAEFCHQAEALGFQPDRIPAVDAKSIQERRGRLTAGEIACFESHRLAWKSLVESGESWLVVFEDDVVLAPAIAPLLLSHDWIPEGVDVVKLETFEARTKVAPKGLPVPGTVLHRLRATHCGSAGYVLSRQTAEWLLKNSESYSRPVDIFLFDVEQPSARNLHIVQMVPALCIQERFLADRAERRPQYEGLISRSEVAEPLQRPRGFAKWRQEADRVFRQIRRPWALLKSLVPSRRLVVPFRES
jgi:glycosyl transferase family 25